MWFFIQKGSTVVVKSFRPTRTTHLFAEERCLQELQDLVPLVPKIEGISDDRTALVLSPVGLHFSPYPDTGELVPCGNDFAQLLDILKVVHSRQMVHRDVRICNFFRLWHG